MGYLETLSFHQEDHGMIMWYVPRVKGDVLGENSLWNRLLVCKFVMVRTLSGGGLGVLVRGSTICSSAFRELVIGICGTDK